MEWEQGSMFVCFQLRKKNPKLLQILEKHKMKYLAAYALCQLSGNAPTKAAVEAVLKAAGVAVDAERLTTLFAEFEGKDFDAVAAEGKKKLVGGSAAPAAAGAAPAAAAAAAPAAKAAAPAEEEEDDEMGFDLFG
jgi:large subunit ribosomal protein LP2